MCYEEKVEDDTLKKKIQHYVDNSNSKWYYNLEEITFNMRKINCPDILILKFLEQLSKDKEGL